MTRRRRIDTLLYKIADFLAACLAWLCFYELSQNNTSVTSGIQSFPPSSFWSISIVIPIGWSLLYQLFDQYKDIYRLSRLATFARTLLLSFSGAVVFMLFLFPILFGNEETISMNRILGYFLVHFTWTAIIRMILLTRASRRLKKGIVTYKTIVVGGNSNALELYQEITGREKGLGNEFIGFIDTNGKSTNELEVHLPKLGKIPDLRRIIEQKHIEEAIIAIETSEHNRLSEILNVLFDFDDQILVRIIPDMYDILLGTVKMNHVFGAILIEIRQELMPRWQLFIKRAIDIVVSVIMLVLLAPLFLFIIIRVRLSSPGPIIFQQERIGLNSQPFTIYKFRSMYINSEETGPQLSFKSDPRCTPFGAVMRKWRLDELPQFYNVLKGDMSLVGPRPERQYFIDQIVKEAPHYKHLLKVRPGITSWGQVKYGYASNVEQMLQRLRFDILYIENMSLALDFKILFYTLLVLLQGKGQ